MNTICRKINSLSRARSRMFRQYYDNRKAEIEILESIPQAEIAKLVQLYLKGCQTKTITFDLPLRCKVDIGYGELAGYVQLIDIDDCDGCRRVGKSKQVKAEVVKFKKLWSDYMKLHKSIVKKYKLDSNTLLNLMGDFFSPDAIF